MYSQLLRMALAAICLFFAYCKEPVIDDSDLVPKDKSGIIYTDTLTVISEVVKEDPLRSDELAINILGSMNDLVFGKSEASIYFQLLLQNNNIDLGTNRQLDSAVLMLQYAGNYGNSKVAQNLVVYEVNETMFKDTDYFSDKTFTTNSNEIGRLNNFVPNFSDSIQTRFAKYAPHARIKLDAAWATNLMNQRAEENFANNGNFLSFLKGLHVKAEATNGKGMVYVDLKANATALMLYYKSTERDSVFTIVVNTDAATVNNFKHDYSGTLTEQLLQNNRSGDSIILMQSMSGVKTKFTVPNIKNLGNISISKAELEITNFKNSFDVSTEFTVPGRLTLNAADAEGKNTFLDDQFIGDSYLGGEKVQQTESNKVLNRYRFNMAVHYQNVISNAKVDYGVYILTFPSNRIADRLIAGGGNHSIYPLKLKLTYTKID